MSEINVFEIATRLREYERKFRLKNGFEPHPATLLNSLVSLARIGEPQRCPTCYGTGTRYHHSSKVVYSGLLNICKTCNGQRVVKSPVFDLNDGNWDCCPWCFEGQNDGNNPCVFCRFWADELGIELTIEK